MTTCPDCGYNDPHHAAGCRRAPRRTFYCPSCAPSTMVRVPLDDARATCATCHVTGYHVNPYTVAR